MSLSDKSERWYLVSRAKLARATGVVAFFTAISKVLGFLRETSLAAVFGASADVDAYLVAQTIPLMFFSIVGHALSTTFTPTYLRVRENEGPSSAFAYANTVLWSIIAVGAVLVIAGEFFAADLVRLVAPGFDTEGSALAAYLSRIIFPMAIFQLVSGVLTGLLHADDEFTVPTTAGLLQNIAIIVAILALGGRYGITAVAIGLLAGTALSTIVKMPAVARLGLSWSPRIDLHNPHMQRMLVLMLPTAVGAGAVRINTLVDRILASALPEGRIAALNYANRLSDLVPGIVAASIMTVVYPTLSRRAAKAEWKLLGHDLLSMMGLVHMALVPIAVGMIVLREPFVRVVYQRGAFDTLAAKETEWALLFLALGVAAISMRQLLNRAFFAMQNTVTPMVLGFVMVGVNIVLNLLLVGRLEQGGLALGTSLAGGISLIIGLWIFRKKFPVSLPYARLAGSVLRSTAAAMAMGAIVWIVKGIVIPEVASTLITLVQLGVLTGVGAVVYAGMLWVLKAPELDLAIRGVRRVAVKVRR